MQGAADLLVFSAKHKLSRATGIAVRLVAERYHDLDQRTQESSVATSFLALLSSPTLIQLLLRRNCISTCDTAECCQHVPVRVRRPLQPL